MLTRLFARLRAVDLRRRINAEIEEELAYHVERESEMYKGRGMPADEARRMALAALGGLAQTREYTQDVRRGTLDVAWQALSPRYLRRQPLYVVSVLLTLTLAVASVATMGAVIKPALIDPLPYRDDARLLTLNTSGGNGGFGPVNVHTLNDLRAGTGPLAAIAAGRGAAVSLTTHDGVFPVNTHAVEPGYFSTLGGSCALPSN